MLASVLLWWISGIFGVVIYIGLFVVFGLGCVQKSKWVWFALGFVFPLLWIIGGRGPAPEPEPF
jgi:hypothetical protein